MMILTMELKLFICYRLAENVFDYVFFAHAERERESKAMFASVTRRE
jgi:hypothetical protein